MKQLTRLVFFLLLASCLSTCMNAQRPTGAPLEFLVREPSVHAAKKPVLLLLHGLGSNEKDLFSLADSLGGQWLIFAVRAPLPMGENGYKWSTIDFSSGEPVGNVAEAEESRLRLIDFINWVNANYATDPGRVYLCGFSQGAMMSYGVSLTRPDLVRGVAILSGRLPEEFKSKHAAPEKLKHLSFFIAHGTDDSVLKIQYARDALAFLHTLGLQPQYHEYPAPHAITPEILHDLRMWLKAK